MKFHLRLRDASVLVLFGALLASSAAFAEKKSHGKKHHQQGQHERRGHGDGGGDRRGHHRDDQVHEHHERHFTDDHRTVVHHYYAEEFNHGRCPPGLAKKRNGCMPPGLAKQWAIGQPLAREVIYYDLPQTILVNLGPPPIGHRYVRVAGDILLIAVGTSMVLDAIADLSAM